jgi:hypothetical protein
LPVRTAQRARGRLDAALYGEDVGQQPPGLRFAALAVGAEVVEAAVLGEQAHQPGGAAPRVGTGLLPPVREQRRAGEMVLMIAWRNW